MATSYVVVFKGCMLLKEKQKESENERLGENVPKGTVSAPSPHPSLHEQSWRKETRTQSNYLC